MVKCRRLGCEAPATHWLVPQYGRRFPVCLAHGTPWLSTLAFFDNRQSAGSRLEAM